MRLVILCPLFIVIESFNYRVWGLMLLSPGSGVRPLDIQNPLFQLCDLGGVIQSKSQFLVCENIGIMIIVEIFK